MRPSQAVAHAARTVGVGEARTLVAHVLGVEPRSLPLAPDLDAAALAALDAAVARRAAGEPLQHITGLAYFRTVELAVGPGVFIPRPETELLAGWAIERVAELRASGVAEPVVIELCAGSGAISKAIATEAPGCRQSAVELSPEAWPWLERNLAGTGVRTVRGDMADALPELDVRVDVVVVNPPYVPETARPELPADVLVDPEVALFSGPDGLDALRVVTAVAARLLRPGGWVGAEHDDSHGVSAPALFAASGGYTAIADHRDLAGRARYVTARRAGGGDAGRMAP